MTDRELKCILISVPSPSGEASGVSYRDLKEYFSMYPGGISGFIGAAFSFMIESDLTGFQEAQDSIYDEYNREIFANLHADVFNDRYRIFRRNIFLLWKYMRGCTEHIGDLIGQIKSFDLKTIGDTHTIVAYL